jgi:hypothetical protein
MDQCLLLWLCMAYIVGHGIYLGATDNWMLYLMPDNHHDAGYSVGISLVTRLVQFAGNPGNPRNGSFRELFD